MNDAVTSATQVAIPDSAAVRIPLACVFPSKTNPRKTFREEGLRELAESIKTFDILQPIVVRPAPAVEGEPQRYEVIAGERRYRASNLAGMDSIPARVVEVNDLDMLELQNIENLQREDLHPLEEAEGYEALLAQHKDDPNYNVDQVAAKLGKSRAYIYARMKLCALQPKCREAFYAGKLNASTALLLARIPVPDLQKKALQEITTERWGGVMSVRAAQEHIQRNYMLRLDQAKFKTADATLLPEAGPCTTCPKRTGANPDLFDDVGRADVCTDPICFEAKKRAHAERLRQAAQDSGRRIIAGAEAKKLKQDYGGGFKGYVKADERYWQSGSDKSVKKLLRGKMPEPVLIEDPHSGEMNEFLPEPKVREALTEAGYKLSRSSSEQNAEQRAAEAKTKLERAYRRSLLAAVHAEVAHRLADTQPLQLTDMRLMAANAFGRLGMETAPAVSALWGWDSKARSVPQEALEELSADQCALLLLDVALAGDCWVSSWSTGKPVNLEAAAERYGVDAAGVRKEVKAAKKPAKPAKPAKAAKQEKAARPTVKAAPKAVAAPASKHPERIKYRHPETGETWTGKGKPPQWIIKAEADGKPRSDFLLSADPAPVPQDQSDVSDQARMLEDDAAYATGDRVRVSDDARGPNGKHMKVCGRVGTVRQYAFGVAQVDFDDGSSHMHVERDQLERIDSSDATSTVPFSPELDTRPEGA